MLRYHLVRLLLHLGLPVLLLAGCNPVQPIVRDGLGRTLPVNNAAVTQVQPVGFPGVFTAVWDATPDPAATIIYLVGEGPDGPGLFQVPAAGGNVTPVTTGEPFADPTGVAASLDGGTIYVADGKAVLGQGGILAVDAATHNVAVVPGSQATAARGLNVAVVDGVPTIYFVGAVMDSGAPAVYRIPATGGTAELLASGSPLVEPTGVTVAADGTAYVIDRLAGGNGLAAVFRLGADGALEQIADGFRTGDRVAGIALTSNDGVLLVSALAPDHAAAQVLGIVLASGDKFVVTKEVELHPGSGGVHRAHNSDTFAWADSSVRRGQHHDICSPCVMRIDTP